MHFLRGFRDELVKTAGPGVGRLAKMMGRGGHAAEHGKMGLGKGLLLAGGAGAGGAVAGELLGKKKGEKKGYGEGTEDTMDIAQRARLLGRQEGVQAYHEALEAQLAKKE